MPIIKTQGYKASDGVVYATYEEAQHAELLRLFTPDKGVEITPEICVEWVLNNQINLIEWLTGGPRSRPSTRKRAGTTNPKRAVRKAATPEQVAAGLDAMREATKLPPPLFDQSAA